MRLDLARVECTEFSVTIDIAAASDVVALVGDMLGGALAWGQYSRQRGQHTLVVSAHPMDDSDEHRTYELRYYPWEPFGPGRLGNPFGVADELSAAISEADDVHVRAHFDLSPTQYDLKLKLPLDLFGEKAFPFNELRGYRGARVKDGAVEWSAVVDHPDPEDGIRITVLTASHLGARNQPLDGLLAMCVGIKDSLVTPLEEGGR